MAVFCYFYLHIAECWSWNRCHHDHFRASVGRLVHQAISGSAERHLDRISGRDVQSTVIPHSSDLWPLDVDLWHGVRRRTADHMRRQDESIRPSRWVLATCQRSHTTQHLQMLLVFVMHLGGIPQKLSWYTVFCFRLPNTFRVVSHVIYHKFTFQGHRLKCV